MSLDPTMIARRPATMPVPIVRTPMHRATAGSILTGAVVPEVPARAARRALVRRARHAAPVWWRRLGRGALAALAGALIAALTVAAMALLVVLG